MGVGIAHKSIDKLKEEQKRLRGCADGTFAGLMSTPADKKDVQGADHTAYKSKIKNAAEFAIACYDYAAQRDLKYCAYGRKVMRCMAVAGRIHSVFTRGKAIANLAYSRT